MFRRYIFKEVPFTIFLGIFAKQHNKPHFVCDTPLPKKVPSEKNSAKIGGLERESYPFPLGGGIMGSAETQNMAKLCEKCG